MVPQPIMGGVVFKGRKNKSFISVPQFVENGLFRGQPFSIITLPKAKVAQGTHGMTEGNFTHCAKENKKNVTRNKI